jgi:antitoxin component of MazEF toxin-antitoxin module
VEVEVQVKKMGDELGIEIPEIVVERLKLKKGDLIEMSCQGQSWKAIYK